jgi:hypothetical protein
MFIKIFMCRTVQIEVCRDFEGEKRKNKEITIIPNAAADYEEKQNVPRNHTS